MAKEDIKQEMTEEENKEKDQTVQEETSSSEVEDQGEASQNALEEKLSEQNDQILRLSAEIKNMQKRQKDERADLIKYRSQTLAQAILPALDNLERALATETDDEVSGQLKKGIQMVQDSLIKALEEEGVEPIDPAGEAFDPTRHQSVSAIPADDTHPKDTVVEVYQKGYLLRGERVLRPAMVVIAQ